MKRNRDVRRPTAREEAAIQRGISQDPDSPGWTDADFARARPATEVLREHLSAAAAKELLRPRGRPKAATRKVAISLRVDAEVLEHFKRAGGGWQTRMNETLRRAARRDSRARRQPAKPATQGA
jgi:uncharacterized protein (DUF4415 family)